MSSDSEHRQEGRTPEREGVPAHGFSPLLVRQRLRHPVSFFRRARERVIESGVFLCGLASILAISLIFFFLFKEGLQAFRMVDSPAQFISSMGVQLEYDYEEDDVFVAGERREFAWQPVSDEPKLSFIPLMWGSLGIATLAAVLSTFAGIGVGIFLSEIATARLRGLVKPTLELLVGIPTVVIGFVMLAIVAQPLRQIADAIGLAGIYGSTFNMFVGAVGVSIVIIPVIGSLVDDALRAVPDDLRAASLSVGATRWQTTWRVVLPTGVSGVFGAVILGFGRALGETMIVLMCAGNAPQITGNPFDSVRTMTAAIASEMGAAQVGGVHAQTLFLVGAILITITFLLNLTVELVVNRFRRKIRL